MHLSCAAAVLAVKREIELTFRGWLLTFTPLGLDRGTREKDNIIEREFYSPVPDAMQPSTQVVTTGGSRRNTVSTS